MRNLLIIGMLLLGAFMAGWFKVQRDGERTTIEIDRTEIRSDARQAIDRGRQFLDRRDQQYADQQYADQQYADQPQPYTGQGQQPYWQQEQVVQQQWGTTYVPSQGGDGGVYQAQHYDDRNYYPQGQPAPNQPGEPGQTNPYSPQPYYPPVSR